MASSFIIAGNVVRRHPLKFLLLVLIEMLFFSLVGYLLFIFSLTLQSSMENIGTFLQSQDWMAQTPTSENIASLNIPLTDVRIMEKESERISHSAFFLALWTSVLFALSRAFNYTLSGSLLFSSQRRKSIAVQFLKSLAISSLFTLLLFLCGWLAISQVVKQILVPTAGQSFSYTIPLIGFLLVLYFFPIAMALAQKEKIKNFLHVFPPANFFSLIRMLMIYLLVLCIAALPLFFAAFYLEQLGMLALILLIASICAIAIGRLVIISAVFENASKEK